MSIIGKASKTRGTWSINPVTKVVKNKKAYDRKKSKQDAKNQIKDYK